MKAKILIGILAITVMLQGLQAQTFGQAVKKAEKPHHTAFKPNVSLSLGTAFISFYPGLNGISSWVAPEVSMPLGKKWTVTAGMAYSSYLTSGTSGTAGFGQTAQNYGTLYVKGRYQVNPKLSITASGYKTFNLSPVRQKNQDQLNPRAIDFSSSGASIRFDYRVNSHFRINAAFSMQQRRYNPFVPYSYGNYYGSPFSPGMPGGFYNGF